MVNGLCLKYWSFQKSIRSLYSK